MCGKKQRRLAILRAPNTHTHAPASARRGGSGQEGPGGRESARAALRGPAARSCGERGSAGAQRSARRAPCLSHSCPRPCPAAAPRRTRGRCMQHRAAASSTSSALDHTRARARRRPRRARPRQRATSAAAADGAGERGRPRRVREAWRTLFLASLSAPLSSSSFTTATWPSCAAQCSGVPPSCARPTRGRADMPQRCACVSAPRRERARGARTASRSGAGAAAGGKCHSYGAGRGARAWRRRRHRVGRESREERAPCAARRRRRCTRHRRFARLRPKRGARRRQCGARRAAHHDACCLSPPCRNPCPAAASPQTRGRSLRPSAAPSRHSVRSPTRGRVSAASPQ